MPQLTPEAEQRLQAIGARYGLNPDAVGTLLRALVAGHGTMAQFNHPALGGAGQWMRGGMTMVGDMFNNALKSQVDSVCAELSALLESDPGLFRPIPAAAPSDTSLDAPGVSLFVPLTGAGAWWPSDLGQPAATGSQNQMRYAYFPDRRRLAVDVAGTVAVYDTLHHQIGGFGQQQGSGASITLTSETGVITLESLPKVKDYDMDRSPRDAIAPAEPAPASTLPAASPAEPAPATAPSAASQPVSPTPTQIAPTPVSPVPPAAGALSSGTDVLAAIERMAVLRDKGILTDTEFTAKKTELLERL